jgi:hypothetical protein
MPEGVGYGPQFTASTGKTLNYIGKHVYAYSGVIGSTSSTADLLEFTTGSRTISAIVLFQLASGPASGVNYWFDIVMNGQIINRQFLSKPYDSRQPSDSDNLHIIIPPYTECKFTGNAVSGDKDFCVILKGKIHK